MATTKKKPSPPPSELPHKYTEDVRAEFAKITAKQPLDRPFRAAFIQSKLRMAHTHPTLSLEARDLAVKQLMNALEPKVKKIDPKKLQKALTQPVPGGVGYGFFYTAAYKVAWGRGTEIAVEFVCPTPPGGNVNTFLYLTATNRSALGVEAFVSYNGQGNTHFRVFDWARTDHWQTDIPFTSMASYLVTISGPETHGHPYQVLYVWNNTALIGTNRYANAVHLYNHVRQSWDLVYQYEYTATDAQQKTGFVGSWGPIVETFQPTYIHTNQMGAVHTILASQDNAGHWGNWAFLAPSVSTIRIDNVGFHPVFLDPNYAFVVNS